MYLHSGINLFVCVYGQREKKNESEAGEKNMETNSKKKMPYDVLIERNGLNSTKIKIGYFFGGAIFESIYSSTQTKLARAAAMTSTGEKDNVAMLCKHNGGAARGNVRSKLCTFVVAVAVVLSSCITVSLQLAWHRSK